MGQNEKDGCMAVTHAIGGAYIILYITCYIKENRERGWAGSRLCMCESSNGMACGR